MRDLKRQSCSGTKNRPVLGICLFFVIVLFTSQAMAIDIQLFNRPLAIKGYINQSVQFGVAGDHYDTMQGFQQGITEALLEFEYYPADNLKLFTTGLLFKDWAYNILKSDDDWKFRRFNEARNEMSLRTDYEDVLKECHLTWTPPGFNFRFGKQIVCWGRMDGVRIMDQINPLDRRLGPSDVEFESTIIPIWLAKMEYFPPVKPPFLDEFAVEFTYNCLQPEMICTASGGWIGCKMFLERHIGLGSFSQTLMNRINGLTVMSTRLGLAVLCLTPPFLP